MSDRDRLYGSRRKNREEENTERKFIRLRQAALEVAEYEHEKDAKVITARKKIEDAQDKVAKAEDGIPDLKRAKLDAEVELQDLLETYIPEGLRKVEKS